MHFINCQHGHSQRPQRNDRHKVIDDIPAPKSSHAEPPDSLMFGDRDGRVPPSSRRSQATSQQSSSYGYMPKEFPKSSPQRSLESPKPQRAANVTLDFQRGGGVSAPLLRSVDFQKPAAAATASELPRSSAGDFSGSGTGIRGIPSNHYHPSYFQRQDSFPLTRESSHHHGYGAMVREAASTQYQDVSQITAVQVTPRPKPRAFPRTNPSFVSTQRRDGGGQPAYRKVDDSLASSSQQPIMVFNQRFQHDPRYYASHAATLGPQMMQTSHSYLGDVAAVKRSTAIKNDNAMDSDTSHSSTSSGASTGRHQYTLDSRPKHRIGHQHRDRPTTASSSTVTTNHNSSVASLSRLPVGKVSTRVSVAAAGGGFPVHKTTAVRPSDESSSSETSPAFSSAFTASTTDRNRLRQQQQHHPRPSREEDGSSRPSSNGISSSEKASRRNSEPDYVNVPTKAERRPVKQAPISIQHPVCLESPVDDDDNAVTIDDDELRNGGTLRISDHISPADYANQDEILASLALNSISSYSYTALSADGSGKS